MYTTVERYTGLVWPNFRFGKLNDTGLFGFPVTIDDDDEMEPELGADAVAIKIHDRERTPSRGYRKDPVN